MRYYVGTIPYSPYLEHFGISGMKWGVRKYQNEDGTLTEAGKARYYKQIDRQAKKDAKRYVNAKQYYGEGAGNRRKLLKGELSEKMKNKDYKKAFDKYEANANYAAATRRAKTERRVRDGAKIALGIGSIAIGAISMYKLQTQTNEIFGNPSVADYTVDLLKNNGAKLRNAKRFLDDAFKE